MADKINSRLIKNEISETGYMLLMWQQRSSTVNNIYKN